MSTRLVELGSGFLAARTSRRGFLRRAALVGSALVAAPATYLLRPGTAYSAICSCSGSDCDCGALCCDGYTEFCCTITGVNACPPGTLAAGWWKADGSGFCDVDGEARPRYYIDCNVADCGSCGCGSSGVCGSSCVDCDCGCAQGSCENRKSCCVAFRYGQCHQELACVGPIVCRVVTCVPPWQWDASCDTTVAVDNHTRFHDGSCLHPTIVLPALPAVVTGTNWALRNTLDAGDPDVVFGYGRSGQFPVMGDWTGTGVASPGMVEGTRFGRYGDEALVWYLRSSPTAGEPDMMFEFGQPGDIPVVGDWNGNGAHTPGVVRGTTWYLRNSNSPGPPDLVFEFGQAGDLPLAGDWDGDGVDGPGVRRGPTWLLRNSLTPGPADRQFDYGEADDLPVVGDWDGDGIDTVGVVQAGEWRLRNVNAAGDPDLVFSFGDPAGRPVPWGRA